MEIIKQVVSALKPLGIETAYQSYDGDADKYIMFGIYGDSDEGYADDEATANQYNITLSYWCMNPMDLEVTKQIKRAMKQSGFKYDGGNSMPKTDDKYGWSMDFIYIEYLD